MKKDLIYEVFAQLQKGEFVRLAWEDKSGRFHEHGLGSYEILTAKVNELKANPDISSIWFSPNPSNSAKYHKEENVVFAHWLYVDIDDVSAEDFVAGYDFIKPTYTVATGHGVQLYWKLKHPVEMPCEEWKSIEKAIERKFDGEKGEPAALLRVPNTFNRKHLLRKYRDKGYTVETECKIIEFNDVAYNQADFAKAGLEVIDGPAKLVKRNSESKRTMNDLKRIRQYCPVVDEAFKSIENDTDNDKTAGHNKRLTVASMIRHTIDDEDYVLKVFGNVSDFKSDITLEKYRSLTKGPITCAKLQEWGLCSEPCQLIKDIGKKSPIVFAYRNNLPLDLKSEIKHFNDINDALDKATAIEKFLSQTVIKQEPVKQDAILKEISKGCNLSIKSLRESLKNACANVAIDYSQSLSKILPGIASSVEKGRVAFDWFEKNGGRFYKDKEHNCYLFYKDNIHRIDSNRPFKSLILKTANISENTIGGKVIFDSMANLAFEKGNKMDSCSWQYTDLINNEVYLSLNNDKKELIKIASGSVEIIKNGNNAKSIILQGSTKMKPIEYLELDEDERCRAFAKIREHAFNNLACAPSDRYLYLSWALAFPLIEYFKTVPHMRGEGSSACGKSRSMDVIAYIIYGDIALKKGTLAANYTDGALNPLIQLDNIETRNLTGGLEDFIITAVTGIEKEKRKLGTDRENVTEKVKTLINTTGIEGLNKPEMINRTFVINFDHYKYGNPEWNELIYVDIAKNRNLMLSAIFQMISKVLKRIAGGELNSIVKDLSTKYPDHSKSRANSYLACMIMIAEQLIEGFGDSISIDELVKQWIDTQDKLSTENSRGTNPIIQLLDSLLKDYEMEFNKQNSIDSQSIYINPFPVEIAQGPLQWIIVGTANELNTAFSILAKRTGIKNPFSNAHQLASRLKDSEKILAENNWTFTTAEVGSRKRIYRLIRCESVKVPNGLSQGVSQQSTYCSTEG